MIANVNVRQILIKRGNTAQVSSYVGPIGELVLDTQTQQVHIQDGLTSGGNVVLVSSAVTNTLASQVSSLTGAVSTITGIDAQFVANINTLLSDVTTILGDFTFEGNTLRNSNAFSISNQILNGGATASLNIPAYGNTTNPITLYNNYGNVDILVGTSGRIDNTWSFSPNGSLEVPYPLPRTFTATLDAAHYVGGSLTVNGNPWYYDVTFAVNPDGTVETQIDGNRVWFNNAGYPNGATFHFTEADHGIPGYTFVFNITEVNAGPAGWGGSISVSEAPIYQPTLSSQGAIKLRSVDSNWVFGTQGNITFPNATTFNGSTFTLPVDGTLNVEVFDSMSGFNRTFTVGPESITLPQGNGIINVGSGSWWLDTANKGLAFPNNDRIVYDTNGGGLELYTYSNPAKITSGQAKTWWFNPDGSLTLPLSTATNTPARLQATGNVQVNANGALFTFTDTNKLVFPDGSVQSTAFTGQDGGGANSTWVTPNSTNWYVRDYNGGFAGSFDGTNPVQWFNPANTPIPAEFNGQAYTFRGAVIEYHAYITSGASGTIIGTIHIAGDYAQGAGGSATHTEHMAGSSNMTTHEFWKTSSNWIDGLFYNNTSGNAQSFWIQWTARTFFGPEYAC